MNAALKIDSKITGYRVVTADKAIVEVPAAVVAKPAAPAVVAMNEKLERPDVLVGSTYKIKTPVSDHAIYLTINDIILNEGTDSEQRRPFEIFINSKNLEQYQWIVALTRIMSAVFRKGGDVTFLVDEMKAVFDPKGGYWQSGGTFMPSIIAEMGHTLERHFKAIGLIKTEVMDDARRQLIETKKAEYVARTAAPAAAETKESSTVKGGQMCGKCHAHSVVKLDGCQTCLECGDSKCS